MITLGRIFQAGFRNFLRNAWLSTAATAVMVVTLTIMSTSFIANMALNSTIHGIVNKIDVSIYLNDQTTITQVQDLQKKLSQVNNVASVQYVSKSEALKRYREQNKSNQTLLQAITEADNPLPASFEVKAKDPNKLEPVVAFVQRSDVKPLLDPATPISYQGNHKKTIDRIIQVSGFIKRVGLLASLIFITISVLIIFNTIRMAIFSRREEIEIMKLIGATNWFIRGPFLCEATFYGLIAAIVALALTYGFISVGGSKIASYIDFNSTLSFLRNNVLVIALIELVTGMIIGTASSLLAMVRYLKL